MADPCYSIPDPDTKAAIIDALTGLFDGIRQETATDAFEVMDSFDWRLFKSGCLLYKIGHRYQTVDRRTGRPINTLEIRTVKSLRFHWDFPESAFAAALKRCLEMRSLMPLGTIQRQIVRHELLNCDKKIVARLAMEIYRLNGEDATVRQCRIRPVRGYEKATKQIVACLEKMGLQRAEQIPALRLIADSGFAPGVYTSKISIALQPDMPAAEALRRIMHQLLSVMRLNLPGVRDDIDSEFLHDFRVSVRRARSLLSQMKGVLDELTTSGLQRQLRSMGAITGNVRDLDVYLLKKSKYVNLVPEVLKPGILQLFRSLQQKRRYAKDRMLNAMQRPDFRAALSDLDRFVQSDPLSESSSPDGRRPIGELARAVIYKRYRRVVKKGRRITDATPDAELHALRIDCKKLRYLLEFFSSLFPKDQMKLLIKQLKQLQENLGDFNDLSVQQAFLVQYLQSTKPQSVRVVPLAAAIGGLITRLDMEHQRVRSQFLSVFDRFHSKENKARFKKLFA
ncbi:MAG: CHAD domain-containing protein [Desulfosarcina sp.]|jgi:CHAD domain-containing protein